MKFFTQAWREDLDPTPGPELWERYQGHLDGLARSSELARAVLSVFRPMNWHDAIVRELQVSLKTRVLNLEVAVPEEQLYWRAHTLRYEECRLESARLDALRESFALGSVEILDDEWHLSESAERLEHRFCFWVRSGEPGGSTFESTLECGLASITVGDRVEWSTTPPRFRIGD